MFLTIKGKPKNYQKTKRVKSMQNRTHKFDVVNN